jgi:hypothetical protein
MWENRISVTTASLNYSPSKQVIICKVKHNSELGNKYKGKFVSCSDLLKDPDIKIISKSSSVLLFHGDKVVGGVIRNATSQKVAEHFGIKMKVTINAHPAINRGATHKNNGIIVGHGKRKNPENSFAGSYVYKNKSLTPEEQKIYDKNGDSFAKWLYKNADNYLPWVALSYEEFKEQVQLEGESTIGALFCAKNYEAVGHIDNDRSEWAAGFVYEEGQVNEGYFFYPEYGVAFEMTSNSFWCWKTKAIHGTATLDLSKGGVRYTAAITLTEKTARAIERQYKKRKIEKK